MHSLFLLLSLFQRQLLFSFSFYFAITFISLKYHKSLTVNFSSSRYHSFPLIENERLAFLSSPTHTIHIFFLFEVLLQFRVLGFFLRFSIYTLIIIYANQA